MKIIGYSTGQEAACAKRANASWQSDHLCGPSEPKLVGRATTFVDQASQLALAERRPGVVQAMATLIKIIFLVFFFNSLVFYR